MTHSDTDSPRPQGPVITRALWLVDSLEEALKEARILPFAAGVDPGRLHLDLLVLGRDGQGEGWGPRAEAELRTYSVPVHRVRARSPRDPRGFLRLVRRLRDGDHHVVHAHGPWSSLWGGLASRLAGRPLVATLYDRPSADDDPSLTKWEDRGERALRRWASRIAVLSGAQWDRYVREGRFPRAMLEVVHQGVQVDAFRTRGKEDGLRLRREAGFPAGGPVAVTSASLERWDSGVDVLLWAIPTIIQEVPQARFVIAGEGAAKNELQRRIRARGLNRVVHWPEPGTPVREILSGGDLFIHPSLRDPFPSEALEAMAAGLPVVATRVGGVPEILGSAEVGRLVPRSDPGELADAVVDLMRRPDELAGMGEAARTRVRERFSAQGWTHRTEGIYADVIQEARRGKRRREWSYARLSVSLMGSGGRQAGPAHSPRTAVPLTGT